MTGVIREVERIEILTLQDNYIDITAMDNSSVVARAFPLKEGQLKESILAEHGFSVVVKTTEGGRTRTMLFDFGFSEYGAAANATTLAVDMKQVEAAALSHGHIDHWGGMKELMALTGRKAVPFVVHPAVFRSPRYLKANEGRIDLPALTRDQVRQARLDVIETIEPYSLLDGSVLFLGEISRTTDFEKGFPVAYFRENGNEKPDPTEDDTAIVMNLRDKGLVIVSGCAHSGIINTIRYAMKVTGIQAVYLVMGGFHLSGPLFAPMIERTIEELKRLNPTYLVPAHCTGHKAIAIMERELPKQFILNMAGTILRVPA